MYLSLFTSTAWKFICTVCSTDVHDIDTNRDHTIFRMSHHLSVVYISGIFSNREVTQHTHQHFEEKCKDLHAVLVSPSDV